MAVAENTNRGLFTLSGITGILIATALLLTILVVLTMSAIATQQKNAKNYYDPAPIVGSTSNLKAISKDNAKFAFQPVK